MLGLGLSCTKSENFKLLDEKLFKTNLYIKCFTLLRLMTVLYQIKRKVIRIKVSIKYVFDYFFQRLYILNILNIKYEKEEEKCPSNMLVSYFIGIQ